MTSNITCTRCERELVAEPDGSTFCIPCNTQSFWQKTWSVFSPIVSVRDIWSFLGLYLYITGFITIVAGLPDKTFVFAEHFIGLKDRVGSLLLVGVLYTCVSGTLLFLSSCLSNKTQRIALGLLTLLSVPAWIYILR